MANYNLILHVSVVTSTSNAKMECAFCLVGNVTTLLTAQMDRMKLDVLQDVWTHHPAIEYMNTQHACAQCCIINVLKGFAYHCISFVMVM